MALSRTCIASARSAVRSQGGGRGRLAPVLPMGSRAASSTSSNRSGASQSTPAPSASTPSTSSSSSSSPKFTPPPPPGGSTLTLRVGTLFTALTAMGIGLTAYGLYEFYNAFATWPQELRDDLRAAIKARNRGDSRRSESYFRKALTNARALDPSAFAPSRLLKTSGIAIALGSLLESEGELDAAYAVYSDALDEVRGTGSYADSAISPRTVEERMRAVSLAQRLGYLAQQRDVHLSDPDTDAERHLVWSVEELLRLTVPAEQRNRALEAEKRGEEEPVLLGETIQGGQSEKDEKGGMRNFLKDLGLPEWVKH